METLEHMPFKARKAVFDKLEQVVDVASMNREEYDIYWRSLNAYRTNLSVQAAALQNGLKQGIDKA